MSIAEKLQTIAENQKKVYDAGFTAGQSVGGDTDAAYNEGYDAGKQAEYDAFWDFFQQNGSRTSYANSFGNGWTDAIFKPKYDMYVTDAYMMFRSTGIKDLANLPVKLDFSKCGNFQYMFQWATTQHMGVLDCRGTGTSELSNTFAYTYSLRTIDKIILKDDGTTRISTSTFETATALTNITFEGVIGYSVSFADCPLSKASIENVMSVLSDTITGLTATFKKTAVDAAFTTDEWNALVATKPNWTITLA